MAAPVTNTPVDVDVITLDLRASRGTRVNDNPAHIVWGLSTPITCPESKQWLFSIIHTDIPRSQFNVTSATNSLRVESSAGGGEVTVSLTPGMYDIYSLASALAADSVFSLNGITVTASSVTGKLTYYNSGGSAFRLDFADVLSTLTPILGGTGNVTMAATTGYLSTNPVDMTYHGTTAYIRSQVMKGNCWAATTPYRTELSDIVAEVPLVSVPLWGWVSMDLSHQRIPIQEKYLDRLEFSLTDRDRVLLQLNGRNDWGLRIRLVALPVGDLASGVMVDGGPKRARAQ